MSVQNQPGEPENPRLYYGADTSGCPAECLPDLIRKRAYEIYLERGDQPGHETEDWLQAEKEIKQRFYS